MVSLCLLGLFELRIVLNETTFRPGEFSRTKTFYLSKDPPSLNTQTVSLSPWLFVFHPPIVYGTVYSTLQTRVRRNRSVSFFLLDISQ